MPFFKDYNDDQAKILVWKYDETDVFNEKQLIIPEDFEKVINYHPKKKLEYLMIRQMLADTLPNHRILYRTIGQPYLFPKDYFISISHSFPFASLAISEKRIGIDLEKINDKIQRIRHKFINQNEEEWISKMDNQTEVLVVIWAIKEALYKLHPSKYWSLKKHYEVEEFDLNSLSQISCRVFDADFEDVYQADVFKLENYYYAIIEENHQLNFKMGKDVLF
ncbi:4'-phosphopantetheinyl transferase family protein [Amniculibacterium aquaticum]|uniref:4'-phosphopantetheinyl transferase family protein n=1 Tax=Amniculibacterium aquaticum TaxID=2479858 RepID=UPI000F5A8719|nr:4'-phosphopantetheinyl transferase superfamily protein [Amniculibacterium aquaticum]